MAASKPKYDYRFKLVLVGDSGVGKSSILMRFADNSYSDNFTSTIGVDFRCRTLKIDKKVVKLQSQERFKTISSAYYRGADGIVLAYDVTSQESYNHVKDWLAEVNRYASEDTSKLIVGNKCDRPDRVVSPEVAQAYVDSIGVSYLESSAKDNFNVEKIFVDLATILVRAREERTKSTASSLFWGGGNLDSRMSSTSVSVTDRTGDPKSANDKATCC